MTALDPKVEKQARAAAELEFRAAHYRTEVEANLLALQEIRDDPKTKARDRVEAIKQIARHIGVSNERPAPPGAKAPSSPGDTGSFSISDSERSRLDEFLKGINGSSN